jgi:hypothetical protein
MENEKFRKEYWSDYFEGRDYLGDLGVDSTDWGQDTVRAFVNTVMNCRVP